MEDKELNPILNQEETPEKGTETPEEGTETPEKETSEEVSE